MASSGSKSPSQPKRRKSHSEEKPKGNRENRSRSSGSSRSSHSSKSNRSKNRKSRSRDNKSKQYGRYPPRRQTQKLPPCAKLFVTNIDSKYSQGQLESDLRNLFQTFGKIKQIIIKTKQGSSNSYVFIQYEDVENAVKAQEELKGKQFKGKQLKVQFGRGERKNEDRKSDKCYICHKQGHFAKDCRYNRFTSGNGKETVSRNYRDSGRNDRDRDRDRERDRRDDRDRRHRRHDSRSRSSSSSHYRRRRDDRDKPDYRRRESRRTPQKRSDYSRRH